MRLLFVIPHYFDAAGGGAHGSLSGKPADRAQTLADCLATLHQQFGRPQCEIDIARRTTIPANQTTAVRLDVIVCTTGSAHLLDGISLERQYFVRESTSANPELLGFECHAVLRNRLGQYDYYCYLEDDLLIHDPWFFVKLRWFNEQFGDHAVLMPNRFEVARSAIVHKAYIDGPLRGESTDAFQNRQVTPVLEGEALGQPIRFVRPQNPHSGCFFLNEAQMTTWAKKSYFLDRDTRFIGPLESAATLGVMRTFRLYKPAPESAGFLEVEHPGNRFLQLIRLPAEGDASPPSPV